MRWAKSLLLALIFCAGGLLIPVRAGAAQPTTQPSPDLSSLLHELSSDDWRTRESAQERLVDLGASARPALEDLLRHTTDPDLRTRLEATLARIDQSRKFGPTLLTLRFDNAPAKAVFDDIARQSGVAFELASDKLWETAPLVTLSADREPFWSVMRRLAPAARLSIAQAARPHALRLEPGPWLAEPSAVAGPLLILPTTVTRSSAIDFAQSEKPERTLSIELNILVDPAVQVSRYTPVPLITEATDDSGQRLDFELSPRTGLAFNNQGQPLRWQSTLSLQEPDRPLRRISRLKGSLLIQVPTRTESAEVRDILSANNVPITVGGHSITVDKPRLSVRGNVYTLPLTFKRGAVPRQDWQQMIQLSAIRQSIRLLDADGKPLAIRNVSPVNGNNKNPDRAEFTFNCSFAREKTPDGHMLTGPPATFIYESVTEVKDLTVPFELKDIVLP